MNFALGPHGASLRLVAAFTCLCAIAQAQPSNSNAGGNGNGNANGNGSNNGNGNGNGAAAAAAWASVQDLSRSSTHAHQPQAFRDAAHAAKKFYHDFPNNAHVPEAKKLEAILELRGVVDGDTPQEQAAQQIARDFRGDAANPLSDRFQVALFAERVTARAALGGDPLAHVPAVLETIAGSLRAEFGDIPQVFNFYTGVARGADMETARRIATSLVQWPANREAAAEARGMLARDALLNQPLGGQLTQYDGQPFDLAQPSGKVTILYAWRPGDPDPVALMKKFQASLPTDAQVVYLAVGGTAADAQLTRDLAQGTGVFCYEENGPAASSLQQLHIRMLPYVYVLDRAAKLSGFGPVSELPNLIAAAR